MRRLEGLIKFNEIQTADPYHFHIFIADFSEKQNILYNQPNHPLNEASPYSKCYYQHRSLLDQSVSRTCRIPDDCINEKRYPLFMARAVLRELIESLQSTGRVSS